jgi:hypothetical protein
MEAVTIDLNEFTPDVVLPVDPEFVEQYHAMAALGEAVARESKVVIVGMARDIGNILPVTIARLQEIGSDFGRWTAVIVENDSTDDTKAVLQSWAESSGGNVLADCRDLGHDDLRGFEASRVQRYATYRNRYRELARDRWPDADYVLAVDMDPWGGFSESGISNSLGWMHTMPAAACMASTSIYRAITDGKTKVWAHYDAWAFRAWGDSARFDRYFPLWLPPPGAAPIKVYSAFGACALYDAKRFYEAEYVSIDGDIEHAGFHKNIREAGGEIYLNPASRVVMHWLSEYL